MNNASSPTVSVVMPTYNRAQLLSKTVASILNQDFEDFDLLIVDDGSTDNTAEVIKESQDQDSRLRYLPLSENRGYGFARGAGLQYVSGRYVALADSDDLWLPGKLRAQVDVLDEYPEIEILFGDFWNIDYVTGTEYGGFAENQAAIRHLTVRPLDDGLWLVEGGFETGILRSGGFIAVATMVLRTDVFKKVGSFDSQGRDLEFCWRAAVLGAQYAYIDRPLIERYRYQSSVTAHVVDWQLRRLEALKICRRTCETAGRTDLLDHVRMAERRTWRKLIRAYGNSDQRIAAIRTFRSSLQSGFSVRNLLFLIMALLGPRAISFATRAWASLSKACRDDLE